MVGSVDGEEEDPGVIPSSSTADGETWVSCEEFKVALDTLKTSMTAEVKGMLKNFLDGLKLSTAPLEVVDPTNKVTDANSDKGEATSEKVPLSSGKSGNDIFAHVEPPINYGGAIPSTHLNHAGSPPKIVKNEDFDAWVYRFKRHLNHVNTNLWRIIEQGFYPHEPSNFTPREAVDHQFNENAPSSSKMQFHPKILHISDLSPWPRKHGTMLSPFTREAQAFNAPTMKWCKMKPMSSQ